MRLNRTAKKHGALADVLLKLEFVNFHHELNVTTIFVTHDQEEAMEVSNRIVIFDKGRLAQIGTPREVYEEPASEFVARFIGVMNVLDCEVRDGVARHGELEFPTHGVADGQRLRIGFRPYAVQVSNDLTDYRHYAVLRHTYFLGVLLRVELELPSGLIIRARMSKEEYARLNLTEGREVPCKFANTGCYPAKAKRCPPKFPSLTACRSAPAKASEPTG